MPLVAGGAIDQPLGLALDILELRAYRDAWAQCKRAKTSDDIPSNAATDLVFAVQAAKIRRRRNGY